MTLFLYIFRIRIKFEICRYPTLPFQVRKKLFLRMVVCVSFGVFKAEIREKRLGISKNPLNKLFLRILICNSRSMAIIDQWKSRDPSVQCTWMTWYDSTFMRSYFYFSLFQSLDTVPLITQLTGAQKEEINHCKK